MDQNNAQNKEESWTDLLFYIICTLFFPLSFIPPHCLPPAPTPVLPSSHHTAVWADPHHRAWSAPHSPVCTGLNCPLCPAGSLTQGAGLFLFQVWRKYCGFRLDGKTLTYINHPLSSILYKVCEQQPSLSVALIHRLSREVIQRTPGSQRVWLGGGKEDPLTFLPGCDSGCCTSQPCPPFHSPYSRRGSAPPALWSIY